MPAGPELPRPIYPGGQPPRPEGESSPQEPRPEPGPAPTPSQPAATPSPAAPAGGPADGPAASPPPGPTSGGRPPVDTAAPTAAPTSAPPRSGSGRDSGAGKLGIVLVAVVALIAVLGVGGWLIFGNDPDSDPPRGGGGGGGGGGGDASAQAEEVAQDALGAFQSEHISCFAGKLDEDEELMTALEPVAADAGFTFDDPAIATKYAEAMAACVDRATTGDVLAAGSGADEATKECIRDNVDAWSDDELQDFIEASVDSSRTSEFVTMQNDVQAC